MVQISNLNQYRIGEQLRMLRLSNKKSVDFIAELLNMSAGNYRKIERGEIELSVINLIKISKFYKVSLERILSLDESTKLFQEDNFLNGISSIKELNKRINRLTERIERLEYQHNRNIINKF